MFANAGYPRGWVYVPRVQKYYRPVRELTTWTAAKTRCSAFGSRSRLVDINNAAENEAIKTFIDTFDRKYRDVRIYFKATVLLYSVDYE